MFKFAKDWLNIYGSDEHAQKAAGHELKGLMRYYNSEGLRVPLMALIDYKGYRLLAMSILPVNNSTILYGSCDGGKRVLNLSPDLSKKMQATGQKLNLKGHMAGRRESSPRSFLYSCADIEGHRGLDGRFYVLDFARVFPPTYEEDVAKTFLYKLLRPEFVKCYKTPLSSDAFSRFGGDDNSREHNAEVVEATRHLMDAVIPNMAAQLMEQSPEHVESRLTELIHRAGINCRYLGLVRCHLSGELARVTLQEMVARVIKSKLKAQMRHKMMEPNGKSYSEDQFRKATISFLNVVLGHSPASVNFWKTDLKIALKVYFRRSLSSDEEEDSHDLRRHINMYRLFRRVEMLTGIKFTKQAMRELERDHTTFKIVMPDIKSISARVKGLNLLSLAEGSSLTIQSTNETSAQGAERLFRLAIRKFESAIRSTPDNLEVLNNLANVLIKHASKTRTPDSLQHLSLAFERYQMAGNFLALIDLAERLQDLYNKWWEDQNALLALSIRCYQAVTKSLQSHIVYEGYRNWGHLLVKQARKSASDRAYADAGEKFRVALQLHADSNRFSEWAPKLQNSELACLLEILMRNSARQGLTSSVGSADICAVDVAWCFRRHLLTNALLNSIVQLRGCTHLLPDTLIAASALTKLDLSRCHQIDNSALYAIVTSSLRTLLLSHVYQISSSAVEHISRVCYNLEELSLQSTGIDNNALTHIAFLTRLHSLSLASTQMDTQVLRSAGKYLSPVRSLDLSDCKGVNEATLRSLGENCRNLTSLSLRSCPLNLNVSCHWLTTCTKLESIDLSYTYDTRDAVVLQLSAAHRHLRSVNLAGLFLLSPFALASLSALSQLTTLDLTGCSNLTNANLAELINNHSALESLAVSKCVELTDAGLRSLDRPLSALHTLRLQMCRKITDEGVAYIAKGCINLRTLDLSLCTEVTDAGLQLIAQSCRKLQVLQLSRCNFVTDSGLRHLTQHLHSLTTLELRECQCITGNGIVVAGVPNLIVLDLFNSKGILDTAVRQFASLALLRYINLQRCHRVTDEAFLELAHKAPSLQLLAVGFNKITDESIEEFVRLRPAVSLHNDGDNYMPFSNENDHM